MSECEENDALRRKVQELSARNEELEAEVSRVNDEAARYRAVFHGVPTPIAMTDKEARFVDINTAFVRFLGHSLDDLRGKQVATISDPGDIKKEGAAFRELRSGQRDYVEYEKRYLRRDGEWTRAHICASFLFDERRRILGAYAQIADVLDGNLASSGSIRAVDARNRAMLDAVPDLVFLMSPEGLIIDCKPSPLVPISKPVASYVEHRVDEAFVPEVAQRISELLREVVSTGTYRIDVYENAEANRYEEAFLAKTQTGDVIVAIRDVTRRVIAEKERDRLAAAIAAHVNELEQWKTLVDGAPHPIALLDMRYVVAYANEAFRALFGASTVIGLDVMQRMAHERNVVDVERRLHTKGHFQGDVVVMRMNGAHVVVDATIFVISDEMQKPTALGCIVRDRTDELNAEVERARLHEEIVNAQARLIRELETPVLPVAPGVLVMPLVGRIDEQRGERIMANLLQGVVDHRATVVILDITGVSAVNGDVALGLVRAARAIGLLGAKTILTGVRAAIARELVVHANEVSELEMTSTLERGVAVALRASYERLGKSKSSIRGA